MSGERVARIVYWDASALLSAFVKDIHSGEARRHLEAPGHNLVSTLAHAEVVAVFRRLERGQSGKAVNLGEARAAYLAGPWRWASLSPGRDMLERLSYRYSLRGADLWHLAMAATLRQSFPELTLLTFDAALGTAAAEHGFSIPAIA